MATAKAAVEVKTAAWLVALASCQPAAKSGGASVPQPSARARVVPSCQAHDEPLECPRGPERARAWPAPAWPSGSDLPALHPLPVWEPPLTAAAVAALVERDRLVPQLQGPLRSRLEAAEGAFRDAELQPRAWPAARAALSRLVASASVGPPLRSYLQYLLARALWNLGERQAALVELGALAERVRAKPEWSGAANQNPYPGPPRPGIPE